MAACACRPGTWTRRCRLISFLRYTFDRVEKMQPGEIADVEIDLFPIGLVFYPGEQLRLVISAQNALGAIMPGIPGYVPENSGQHVIHTGGPHASYLQLPVKDA